MYLVTGDVASVDELDRFRALLDRFDILRGPGECRMSTPADTLSAYGPVLPPWPGRRVVRLQLVALYASQQIPAHADQSIAPCRRLHIPLLTNAGCWSFHEGAWQQLQPGAVYEMDPAQLHGAVNWGATTRVHLMVDVEDAR